MMATPVTSIPVAIHSSAWSMDSRRGDGAVADAVSTGATAAALPSSQRRDAQDPAGLDHVGILHGRGIGFHDLGVFRAFALAVMLLGDLPQGVALLDRVHRRLRRRLLD